MLFQENAHFSISESLIAAIELMKYNMRRQEEEGEEEGDSDSEIQQLKQRIRLRRQQIQRSRLPPCTSSQHSKAVWDVRTERAAICSSCFAKYLCSAKSATVLALLKALGLCLIKGFVFSCSIPLH